MLTTEPEVTEKHFEIHYTFEMYTLIYILNNQLCMWL